jgi:hypothetical protein
MDSILHRDLVPNERVVYAVIGPNRDVDKEILPCLKEFSRNHPEEGLRVLIFGNGDKPLACSSYFLWTEKERTWISKNITVEVHGDFNYLTHVELLGILSFEMKEKGGLLVIADFEGGDLLLDTWKRAGYPIDESVMIISDVSIPIHLPPWNFGISVTSDLIVSCDPDMSKIDAGPAFFLASALKTKNIEKIKKHWEDFQRCENEVRECYLMPLHAIFSLSLGWDEHVFQLLPEDLQKLIAKNPQIPILKKAWETCHQHTEKFLEACSKMAVIAAPQNYQDKIVFSVNRIEDVLKSLYSNFETGRYTYKTIDGIFASLRATYDDITNSIQATVKASSGKINENSNCNDIK